MKVCDLYNKILEDMGGYYIYGLPGSFIMPFWNAISGKNKLILARHENGALFMADGFARATGRMGVAVTTVGPGVTNSITGLACAYQDSIPLLVIAGMGPVVNSGKGMFQNCDCEDRGFTPLELLEPVTKKCFLPMTGEAAVENLYEAIQIAYSGRKGPVHISLPLDVQNMDIDDNYYKTNFLEENIVNYKIDKNIIDLIKRCRRPIFLCGWGTHLANASIELERLSQATQIPIVATIKGVSSCSEANKMYIGIIGNVMCKETRETIKAYDSDLIISIGSSLSMNSCPEFENLFGNEEIIQVDIDDNQFNRYRKTTFHVHCDAKVFVRFLLQHSSELVKNDLPINKPQSITTNKNNFFSNIVRSMNNIIKEDVIVIPDAGNHWLDVLYWYKPKNICSLMTNNGLASMGHAIGAAIGMSCAYKNKKVICVTGDGSFLMSGYDISTAVNYNLDIIFIVANNSGLGRVRQYQLSKKEEIKGSLIEYTSIKQCAKGLGADAYCCSSLEEFEIVLKECMKKKATSVIEVIQDKNDRPILLE